jgi:hypothetical protein
LCKEERKHRLQRKGEQGDNDPKLVTPGLLKMFCRCEGSEYRIKGGRKTIDGP